MSWIKRNLYFLVGGVLAAALLGLAGWYCYSKWQLNNQNLLELDKRYTDWNRIITGPSNPGNEQVNNTEIARQQVDQVRTRIRDARRFIVPITPIPNPGRGGVSKDEFYSVLRSTILQLQKDAGNNGVTLSQPNYYFSFKAQQQLYNFPPGSLGPLSIQLAEVKAICEVLFRAKINSLDNLQRERGTSDDQGVQSDYLDPTLVAVTNELAVLTPYVIQFQCFSAELASVLTGFANDRHGIIVKAINIEQAGSTTPDVLTGAGFTGTYAPTYAPPTYAPTYAPPGYAAPGYAPPGYAPGFNPAAQPLTRGGLQVVLDEKPLRVTLVLQVVRLLPR